MSKDIERRILSMLKYSALREKHNLNTHYGLAGGKRKVSDGLPDGEIRSRLSSTDPASRLIYQTLVEELREHVACFTSDQRYVTLIERRLLLDESIKDLAEELKIPYQSARRKVSQARWFLGKRMFRSFYG